MKQNGAHQQLSVFMILADRAHVQRLASQIESIIDPEVDRVLIAPLDREATSRLISFGKPAAMPGPAVVIAQAAPGPDVRPRMTIR